MLSVLIRNAEVIDGSGGPQMRADVAVEGGRIAAVGALEGAQAKTVLDAAGCAVTPGFVDMHSHADFSLPLLPTADSLVQQGITTAVVGQCGATLAPLFPETRAQVIESYQSADLPLPWDEWSSFGSFLDYLARTRLSANVVPLVGQGTVRAGVMGFSAAPADPEQVAAMQAAVGRAMDEGAIGVSSGLIYPPGSYASTEELIAVARPAGARDGFYFSHIRGEGATLLEAVAEAIRIGRETGAAVQISHFKASGRANWGKSAQALELIDRARAEGLDVTADLYPYLAGSTGLSASLPEWAQEGGRAPTLARLADPEARGRILEEMASLDPEAARDWSAVWISGCPSNRGYEGRCVEALAAEAGKPPAEWVLDTLIEAGLDVEMVLFGMSEENRHRELRHPAMMIGTDGYALATEGPLARGKPHPRNFGTFPRVLAHYVREQGVISLEEAVHRMSGLPARKLRWRDRGLLRSGYQADLVVFDPVQVADRATFEAPHQYPAGIRHVLVNGELVIRDGAHTGARPGLVLGR
jgi:N-acyl-D-amino-acid deacylase